MICKTLIKEMRLQRGWSQAQLAEIMAVSTRTVQRIEKLGECSLESKLALATAFGVSTDELEGAREKRLVKAAQIQAGIFYLCIIACLVFVMVISRNGLDNGGIWIFHVGLFTACSILSNGFRDSFAFVRLILRYVFGKPSLDNPKRTLVTLRRQITYAYTSGIFAFLLIGAFVLARFEQYPDSITTLIPHWLFVTGVWTVMLAELILRPLKHRLEGELLIEIQQHPDKD